MAEDCSQCGNVWLYNPEMIHKCTHAGVTIPLPNFPVRPDTCPTK